jgi:hypothetical protein
MVEAAYGVQRGINDGPQSGRLVGDVTGCPRAAKTQQHIVNVTFNVPATKDTTTLSIGHCRSDGSPFVLKVY